MTTIYWHFASNTLRDGSAHPEAGTIMPEITDPVPCERGYHGSLRLIDALSYAPGPYLAQTALHCTVIAHGEPVDKHCASIREYLTGYVDVSDALRLFTRRAVLHAVRVDAANAMDSAGLKEQASALRTIHDDASYDDIRAASYAASAASYAASAASDAASYAASAASDAASDAARYAARAASDAARYAASAASDAASYAASYAARAASYAASDAASDAARYAASAASDAASYAARYAARERLNTWLEEEVMKVLP